MFRIAPAAPREPDAAGARRADYRFRRNALNGARATRPAPRTTTPVALTVRRTGANTGRSPSTVTDRSMTRVRVGLTVEGWATGQVPAAHATRPTGSTGSPRSGVGIGEPTGSGAGTGAAACVLAGVESGSRARPPTKRQMAASRARGFMRGSFQSEVTSSRCRMAGGGSSSGKRVNSASMRRTAMSK